MTELGDNLLTNGTFTDSGSPWTEYASPTAWASDMYAIGQSAGIQQTGIAVEAGKQYRITFTASQYGGGPPATKAVNLALGSATTGAIGYILDTPRTIDITALETGSVTFVISNEGDSANFDNVSLQEILQEILPEEESHSGSGNDGNGAFYRKQMQSRKPRKKKKAKESEYSKVVGYNQNLPAPFNRPNQR